MDRPNVSNRRSKPGTAQELAAIPAKRAWPNPAPSVHDLLVKHTERMMTRYGDSISMHAESALLRMHYCRTTALGTRVYRCDPCGFEKTVHNSCGDRNCPNCSGAKRRNWLDKTKELIAPGVTYFQVVFTLPEELSALALGNRGNMYDILFEVAWKCLRHKVEKELGIQCAGLAVLHTWNQHMGHHPHVHLAVPGNGPSLDGERWVNCKLDGNGNPFLVDNKELSRDFRTMFLSELRKLVERGEIQLEESCYIADELGELSDKKWCVFVERPPKPTMPAEQMLKYLARYMTGGPISDRRILGESDGSVWFLARSKTKGVGQVETSLTSIEFVRRWSLHILPREYTRVRHFGAWSSSKRGDYARQCERLAPAPNTNKRTDRNHCDERGSLSQQKAEPDTQDVGRERPTPECPHCGKCTQLVRDDPRPSWRELYYGPDHPRWFEWTSKGKKVPELEESVIRAPEQDIFDEIIALRRSLDAEIDRENQPLVKLSLPREANT